MQTLTAASHANPVAVSSLDLALVITEPNVLTYLAQFPSEEVQCDKALEALKVGVIAILSASPTLDTQVVQAKFSEVEGRMRGLLGEFQKKVTDDLCRYFAEQDGVVPRSIEGIFGERGEDFYVTVDKDDLTGGRPLPFLDSAYKIARALTVAAARKDQAGEFDLQKVRDQVDALAAWSDRIADLATKARTIQNSGKLIEQCANDLKQDLDARVAIILKTLQQAA